MRPGRFTNSLRPCSSLVVTICAGGCKKMWNSRRIRFGARHVKQDESDDRPVRYGLIPCRRAILANAVPVHTDPEVL